MELQNYSNDPLPTNLSDYLLDPSKGKHPLFKVIQEIYTSENLLDMIATEGAVTEDGLTYLLEKIDKKKPHITYFKFKMTCKKFFGLTPIQLFKAYRLDILATNLLNEGHDVGVIACELGYLSHEAFTTAFRNRHFMSPLQFRKKKM